MKTFFLSYFVIFVALVAVPLIADDKDETPPDVESLMTPEDFVLSGLDKLNQVERAHLSEWLEKYRDGAVKVVQVQKPRSQMTEEERQAEKDLAIAAKVIPSFRGWRGKTIFRLDNGTVWQQRMPGTMYYTGTSSDVVITKNIMGRFVLQHVESERQVLVKRVE
ncbi:MAG TPA: hypothetical protein VJ984_04250 [Xanthomonadales bacterium]|nr:hypothetical protein [Xanthomonadales bacterium]